MKRILFFFILFISLNFSAQEEIKWEVSFNAESKEIQFKATLKEHWHLYSQHVLNDLGPVPTSFHFDFNKSIVFEGPVLEPKPIEKYDPSFEATLNFFENEVVFTRKIKEINTKDKNVQLTGTITYMVCDETRCIPPSDFPFTITIQ